MSDSIAAILFVGGNGPTQPLLTKMQQVRWACAQDTLARLVMSKCYDPIVVATNDEAFKAIAFSYGATVDMDPREAPFHFGRRLFDVIDRHRFDRVLYLGAAACPLLRVEDFTAIAEALRFSPNAVIANNIHSTDWAAIQPARIVGDWIDRLETDNALGWVLSHEAGLKPMAWGPSAATRLDIDVPIDAQLAALHPQCGPALRQVVAGLNWSDTRLRAARQVLATPASRVILAGRVPSWAWAQVEKSTQCWVRVYSEERGMRAAGRLQSGQVRSVLNEYARAVGLEQLIELLSELADAVLWDTRVLWAAKGVWPGEVDRYASDLGQVEAIGDPFIRRFTQLVVDAPIPIVTGGHTLVSGGLWALLESMDAKL
jgi:hypothetical protein